MPSSSFRPNHQPAKRKHYLVDGSDSEHDSDGSYSEPYVQSDDSEPVVNIQPRRQTKKASTRKQKKSPRGDISDFMSQKLTRYRVIYEQLMKANSRLGQKSVSEFIDSLSSVERQTVLSIHQVHNYKSIIAAEQRSIILKFVKQSTLLPPSSSKIKNHINRGNPRSKRSSPTNKRSKSSTKQSVKRSSKQSSKTSESESESESIEQSDSEYEYESSSQSDNENLYISQLFDQSINQSPTNKKSNSIGKVFRPTIEKIGLYRSELYPRLMKFRLNNRSDNRSSRRSSDQSNQQGIDRLQSEFTINSLKNICSVNQIHGYSDLRYRELAALVFQYLMDDRLIDPNHYSDDQILNLGHKTRAVKSFNHSDHSDQSDQSASDFDEQPLIQLVKGSINQSTSMSTDIDKPFEQLNAEYSSIYRKILGLDWHNLTEHRLSHCINQSELIAVSRIHGFDVSNLTRAQLLTQVFQLIDENIIVRPPELPSQHRSVRY